MVSPYYDTNLSIASYLRAVVALRNATEAYVADHRGEPREVDINRCSLTEWAWHVEVLLGEVWSA